MTRACPSRTRQPATGNRETKKDATAYQPQQSVLKRQDGQRQTACMRYISAPQRSHVIDSPSDFGWRLAKRGDHRRDDDLDRRLFHAANCNGDWPRSRQIAAVSATCRILDEAVWQGLHRFRGCWGQPRLTSAGRIRYSGASMKDRHTIVGGAVLGALVGAVGRLPVFHGTGTTVAARHRAGTADDRSRGHAAGEDRDRLARQARSQRAGRPAPRHPWRGHAVSRLTQPPVSSAGGGQHP